MVEDLGKRLRDLIQSRVQVIPEDDAGSRMIEEAVELALAMGATASKILTSVADALHNEAKKAGNYPSNLNFYLHCDPTSERRIELSDMLLQIKYLANLSDIPWEEVEIEADEKMTSLENLHEENNLTIYPNGKIYRNKRD